MSNYYDENELIRRIQKGDESALAIIISEYHAYVGKIVYSILGSYSHKIDLQGVVNQIFFTLWHKANKIDPSKSVTIKGYLGTLARNTAINEKKKCIPDYQINDEVIADISDFPHYRYSGIHSKKQTQTLQREDEKIFGRRRKSV